MKNQVNGVLWKTTKKSKSSPDLLGKIELSPALLAALLKATKGNKTTDMQVACWSATSKGGNKYYRVEATPMYQSEEDTADKAGRSEGLFGLD